MMTRYRDEGRLILLMMIGWLLPTSAATQTVPEQSITPASLLSVRERVPAGAAVHVTDAEGSTVKGALMGVTEEAVLVQVGGHLRTLTAADVRRVQWQQPDSPWSGVLIGAAVGAIPGLYWLVADPNECTGMCPEEYALIAIGGLVGGVIDSAVTKKLTVFDAGPPSGGKRRVSVRLFMQRARSGLQVAVRF